MGRAFQTHNDLGRLLDERVYRNALKERCAEMGIRVDAEFRIVVSVASFSESFFVDLIREDAVVYELKADKTFHPSHDAQLLDYLFLLDLNFGEPVNFRTDSVRSRIVSTSLNRAERQPEAIIHENFEKISRPFQNIPEIVSAILQEWGTHLDFKLYREAILSLPGIDAPGQVAVLDRSETISK